MSRAVRNMRKVLDAVASHNEAAALDLMRAVEQIKDDLLRQRLLNAIHQLNQDADELRLARDELHGQASRLG